MHDPHVRVYARDPRDGSSPVLYVDARGQGELRELSRLQARQLAESLKVVLECLASGADYVSIERRDP